MALIHVPPADAATAGERFAPTDEIIDLADRRRVLLYAVLGVDVDETVANAVFDVRPPSSVRAHRPPMTVGDGRLAVEDAPSSTA